MRILHVTSSYLPHRSGVTIAIDGWVRALRALGHEVAVWTVGESDEAAGVYTSPSVGEISDGFPLPVSFRAPRPIREREWDVVHTHHPLFIGTRAVDFARERGAVLASTAHSDYLAYVDAYMAGASKLLKPPVRARIRDVFSACDIVFAPSAGIERALGSWGVHDRVVRCTYPVDAERLCRESRSAARAELGLTDDEPIALYVGRIAAEKRVVELIDEFEVTLAAVPSARLVIVGDGPEWQKVKRAAEVLGDRVLLTGELANDGLGAWYSAADVFVSASRNEVGPLVAIEAGMCATPTVARRAPGFEDRIVEGRTGRLVAESRGALGEAVAELLGDRDRAHAMGEAARSAFAEHTPQRSASLLADAYLRTERSMQQQPVGGSPRRLLGAD